jgi:hypothetical protein
MMAGHVREKCVVTVSTAVYYSQYNVTYLVLWQRDNVTQRPNDMGCGRKYTVYTRRTFQRHLRSVLIRSRFKNIFPPHV